MIAAPSRSKNITLSHNPAAMDHYWTRQRAIDATVAFVALAATELGRGYYQPVIVAHRIDDLHLADTLAAAD